MCIYQSTYLLLLWANLISLTIYIYNLFWIKLFFLLSSFIKCIFGSYRSIIENSGRSKLIYLTLASWFRKICIKRRFIPNWLCKYWLICWSIKVTWSQSCCHINKCPWVFYIIYLNLTAIYISFIWNIKYRSTLWCFYYIITRISLIHVLNLYFIGNVLNSPYLYIIIRFPTFLNDLWAKCKSVGCVRITVGARPASQLVLLASCILAAIRCWKIVRAVIVSVLSKKAIIISSLNTLSTI